VFSHEGEGLAVPLDEFGNLASKDVLRHCPVPPPGGRPG
jgi:hypothetical protein